LIDNNFFVQSSPAIHIDARGRTWQRSLTQDPDGALHRGLRDVPYQRPPYATKYPTLPKVLEDSPGVPLRNVIRRSGVIGGEALELVEQTEALTTIDRIFTESDFRFARGAFKKEWARAEEFELAPDSPALREGFRQLPLNRMDCSNRHWRVQDSGRVNLMQPPC
jgi:hypothetical protein